MSLRPVAIVAPLAVLVPALLFACYPPQGVTITNGPASAPPSLIADAGPSDWADAAGCTVDAATCGGACVDLQSDSQNCGVCGVQCLPGQLCAGGACVADVLTKLAFDVVDAEYSRALDGVVAVSASPAALHLYDPGANGETTIGLPKPPTCVSLDPDGHKAVVGHDAFVSYVDLDAQRVLGTFPVSDAIGDVVAGGNGKAYAFPSSDQGAIHEIDLATGTDTPTQSGLYLQARAKLHPNRRSIYGVQIGVSPGSLLKYDDADGGLTPSGRMFGSTYDPCGDLWIGHDGLRIFTGCGYVFRASDDQAQDMQYAGSLAPQQTRIASVDDTPSRVAAIFSTAYWGSPATNDQLVTFDAQYLAQRSAQAMPRYLAGTKSVPTGGRFVFFRADGQTMVVIVIADPSSNAEQPFAIATL